MKYKYLISGFILITLIWTSCKQRGDLPNTRLITELINATIKQDSLDPSLPISIHLIDYFLYQNVTDTNNISDYNPPPPPPPPSRNSKGEKPFIFEVCKQDMKHVFNYTISKSDSIFIVDQITLNKNITLDRNCILEYIKVEDIPSMKLRERLNKQFYSFNIPIFNKDKNLAVLEYDHHCPRCGHGKIVFLKRIENHWTIVKSFTTWRS